MQNKSESTTQIIELVQKFVDEREPGPAFESDAQAKKRRQDWIADAARRVSMIQIATHTLKAIHPDAKGTNLYALARQAPHGAEHALVGTHSVRNDERADDVVGWAGALDVFKFLRLSAGGESLLSMLRRRDERAVSLLSDDAAAAQKLRDAFVGITEDRGAAASHRLAAQLYFPLGGGGYHMLAPLFASSLVHAVHERLREARFSEASKAARAAKRDGRAHPHGYSNFLGTAVRIIGGSKPQNVSQLNSERGGANELLSSVPPVWQDQGIKAPLGVATVFDRSGPVGGDSEIRAITKQLRGHLLDVVDRPSNLLMRDKRAQLVNAVIDRVLDIATALQCLPPGWSAQPACELSWAQKQWLDGDAVAAAKAAFEKSQGDTVTTPHATEWRERVAGDFAKWLCAQISTRTTPMGDPEYVFLKHEFLKAMP